MMRRIVLAVVAAMLIPSAALCVDPGPAGDVAGFEELAKSKGLFKKTLIRPDADFSRYGKLVTPTVRLQVRASSRAGGGSSTGTMLRKRSKSDTAPDREDLVRFGKIINQTLADELARSQEFELVEEAGSGTLILRSAVLDIATRPPSKMAREAGVDGRQISEGTLVFDLIDAKTGVIQARISERQKIRRGDESGSGDAAAVWAEVERWAHGVAAQLRQELERARQEDAA
jgi:hypothetical protein